MLDRYSLAPMRKLWSAKMKFAMWLKVELAFLASRVEHDNLDRESYDLIYQHADFNLQRIETLDELYNQDMIAFITSVQKSLSEKGVGHLGKELHEPLTSYDIEDPALILLLRQALELVNSQLLDLFLALSHRANEQKWTIMIARTHGQWAEPTTFGQILLVYANAVKRSISAFNHHQETTLSEGKIAGAVGNFAGMDPQIAETAVRILGLTPVQAETQIIQRDRHARLLCEIAIAGGTIENIAQTLWLMAQSEVGEIREPRKTKQRGSSRMSYKRNPIGLEQLQGLPRLLRAYAQCGMENIATPGWRAIEQSSVERHVLPDATSLLHYMANKLTTIVEKLEVFPDRMRHNMECTGGVWACQAIRSALMKAGISYDTAYEYTQRLGFTIIDTGMRLDAVAATMPLSETDSRTSVEILGADTVQGFLDPRRLIERGIKHLFRS